MVKRVGGDEVCDGCDDCLVTDRQAGSVACRSCTHISGAAIGLDRTVVSIVHCGCTDPGSIPGLDIMLYTFGPFAHPPTQQEP